MDMLIKLTIPNYIYRFYQDASRYVAGCSPENIMSDALCAYAGLLNDDVCRQLREALSEPDSKE